MKNLTRDEAVARAALLHVESYDLALDLREAVTGDRFLTETVIRFSCHQPGSTFVELDAELLHADLDGVPLPAPVGNRIALDVTGEHVLTVRSRGTCSRTGEGLHRFLDPADGAVYLYAQSFLDDAQRIFACFDQPDLKAVLRLRVTAPDGWTVVGNERGTQQGHTWTFAPTQRLSTYLFTVAAGPWHSVRRELCFGAVRPPTLEPTPPEPAPWSDDQAMHRIEVGLHCRRSLAPYLDADVEELFEVTGQCLTLQQQLFGRRYPFGDTYDQLFVPEFNAGAMENPGAVTFREEFLFRSRVTDDARRKRAMVMAHEMAHMWFGDLVTMRWWDDLWLNESFPELLGYLTVDRATRFTGTWADFTATRKAWGYRADQLPSTHPVQGDVADTRGALLNFDGISYAKGASVLRQLMATVGEDMFFTGVRAYVAEHEFGSTGFADLLRAVEVASGRDLQDWARAWLQTTGVSTLRVTGGTLVQESDVVRPHRVRVGWYDAADAGPLVLAAEQEVDLAGDPVLLQGPDCALVLPNDGDLTFAKLRLDASSLSTVRTGLSRVADPLARALVWGALWDTCRDAELPAADFVAAVLAGVDGERDPSVVTTLLTQARTAATLFSRDGDALRDCLATASWTAATTDPGSDLQLVHLRAFAAVTRDVAPLKQLLDGQEVPAGVVVDTELRWHLVEHRAALGGVRPREMFLEVARDDTAAGRLHAFTATSACPSAGAKQAAWQRLTALDGSAYELEAIAAGFWQVDQDALLRPYVQRYVDALPRLWADASPQVAGELAQRLFPWTLVEPMVLEATAALLADEHPVGLRRYVAEQRADLQRALAARA